LNFHLLLRKHGFKIPSLAKEIGISKGAMYSWCKGTSFPKYDTLKRMSVILNESIEDIVNSFNA